MSRLMRRGSPNRLRPYRRDRERFSVACVARTFSSARLAGVKACTTSYEKRSRIEEETAPRLVFSLARLSGALLFRTVRFPQPRSAEDVAQRVVALVAGVFEEPF